jgi:hypothetical protein
MHAHLSEPPPAVTDERAELPGAIDVVIARAMAKDPADRYQTAGDLVSETTEALKARDGGVLLRTFMIADVRGYTTFTREQGDERAAELAGRFAEVVRGVVSATRRCPSGAPRRRGAHRLLLRAPGDPRRGGVTGRVPGGGAPARDRRRPRCGGGRRSRGRLSGAALNLAARLCGKAAAGEVLASEAVTHMAAHVDGVAYTGLRTFDLKGFDEPVRAVRVVTDDELAAMPPARPEGERRGIRRRITGPGGGVRRDRAGGAGPATDLWQAPDAAPTSFRQGVAIIDQETHDVVAQVPIQDPVEGYFADGSFWFLNLEPLSFVQIDATTFRIVSRSLHRSRRWDRSLVDGPSLWVTDATDPVLWRMDIRTRREAAHYDYSAEGEGGLDGPAVGAGSIWTGVGRNILRVDPSTGAIQARIVGGSRDDPFDLLAPDVSYSQVTRMSFSDGALFIPSFQRLVRIDPSTNGVAYAAGTPTDVKFVTGGDGFGWATSEAGNSVFQVSPRGYKIGEFRRARDRRRSRSTGSASGSRTTTPRRSAGSMRRTGRPDRSRSAIPFRGSRRVPGWWHSPSAAVRGSWTGSRPSRRRAAAHVP